MKVPATKNFNFDPLIMFLSSKIVQTLKNFQNMVHAPNLVINKT